MPLLEPAPPVVSKAALEDLRARLRHVRHVGLPDADDESLGVAAT